jgi:protein gp37
MKLLMAGCATVRLEALPSLNLKHIDWVIVGGESGPGARPMDEAWVVNIKDQCQSVEIPFFFKQWGGTQKRRNGRRLQGRIWEQIPKQPGMLPLPIT